MKLEEIQALQVGDYIQVIIRDAVGRDNGTITVERQPDTKTGKRVYRTTLRRITPFLYCTKKTWNAETALYCVNNWGTAS